MCWTLIVEYTSIPAASNSSTSCQRLGCLDPCTLECASSSIRIRSGFSLNARSKSNSLRTFPLYSTCFKGNTSNPSTKDMVSLRPWVSTIPTRTFLVLACWWAAVSIAYVLPTPAVAPKKIFSFPRPDNASSL